MSENSFYISPIEGETIFRCLLCGNETRNIHIKVCNDCVQILSQIIKEKRNENKQGE